MAVDVLLDTNVVSETTRQRGDENVIRFLDALPMGRLSVVTIYELHFGLERLPKTRSQAALARGIRDTIERYAPNIIEIDEAIARIAGDMRAMIERSGRKLPIGDALIAATAQVHDLTLATRNTKDFEGLGVPLINPWAADA